jgi:hypothetical protein
VFEIWPLKSGLWRHFPPRSGGGFLWCREVMQRVELAGSAFRSHELRAPHGAADHGWRQKGPLGNVAGVLHGALGQRIEVSEGWCQAVNGSMRRKAWANSAPQSENATRRGGPTTITGPPRPQGLGRTAMSTSTMAMSTATMTATTITLPCRCCEGVRSSERHFQGLASHLLSSTFAEQPAWANQEVMIIRAAG